MDEKIWFEEAVKYGLTIYTVRDTDINYIVYKGFKITKTEGRYFIQDIRLNDFYTNVDKKQIITLKENGFIKGADIISYERNKRRIAKYISLLEKLYENKEEYVKKYNNNASFYEKKLNNCREGILKYSDLLFFYKAKILQHEIKYNLKINQDE